MRYKIAILEILAILSIGSDCEQSRLEALDNGIYGIPAHIPLYVISDDPALPVEEQCNWWNNELSRDGEERVFLSFDGSTEYLENTLGVINVTKNFIITTPYEFDSMVDTLGEFRYAMRDGEILYGSIVINSDIAYSDETTTAVLRHELGHAIGLKDDSPSIDLNSIMSSLLMIDGELTANDFNRLIDLY